LRSFSRKGTPRAFAPRLAVARFELTTGPKPRNKQADQQADEPPHDAPRNVAAAVYAAQTHSPTHYYTLPGETL
jgi:hypothetical protein